MRQKHKKRTYKALYMMQLVFTGTDRRIMMGHSKIDYIDDEVIRAAGKDYNRDDMGKVVVVRNDINCVALKTPYLCDMSANVLINDAMEYVKENAPLNISCWYMSGICNTKIANEMNEEDIAGFRILASVISNIKGNGIENSKVILDENALCKDLGVSSTDLFEYCDRQLRTSNIFNWFLQYSVDNKKKIESHQIVTDAKCVDGRVEVCFNSTIMLDLCKYAKFFASQMESIKACENTYEQYLQIDG